MSANTWKDEMDITLNGISYVLRPSFAALCEMEKLTGNGLFGLARKVHQGNFSVHELAAILWCCMKPANAEVPDIDTLGELLVQEGVTRCIGIVTQLITRALMGIGSHA